MQIGQWRVHEVRTRGGNSKYRALRLDAGNFAWSSEGTTRKTRIIDVVYNASNNELVRTKTLVKNAIVVIDATPFRQWYESHYILPLGRKRETKGQTDENDVLNKKRSRGVMAKYLARQKFAKVDPALEEQFCSGRILGKQFLFYLFHNLFPRYFLYKKDGCIWCFKYKNYILLFAWQKWTTIVCFVFLFYFEN